MEYGKAPWKVVGHNWQNTTIYDADETPICKLDLEDWDVTEDNQDELETYQAKVANLISAAPELLEALEAVLEYLDDRGVDKWLDEMVTKAIAKAKGTK